MIKRVLWGGLLLLCLWLGMGLAFQRPFTVPLQLGNAEGFNNDQPWVRGFYEPEARTDSGALYRWTSPQAALVFPAIPARPAMLILSQYNGVPTTLDAGGWSLAGLEAGRTVHVFLPPLTQPQIGLTVDQPWPDAPDDSRALGAALRGGWLYSLNGWAWPPWMVLLAWGGVLVVLLGVVWLLGATRTEGLLLGSVLSIAAIGAVWFAPLRVSHAAQAVVLATGYGLLFIGLGMLIRSRSRYVYAIPQHHWRWLLLLTTAIFSLKLGGRLVPDSMPGDIGFHRNRVLAMLIGDVFRPASHRGVATTYPPIFYMFVQPLLISGISIEWLLQGLAALCEALALPVIWVGVRECTGNQRAAWFAAALYGAFPAGFMNMAWSFDAHIFTQWAVVAWCVALVLTWGRWHERQVWLALGGGLCVIMLGHFGFYVNISLLGATLIVALFWRARRQALALLAMFVAAQVVAWLLYYSAFIDIFLAQATAVAEGGATNLTQRDPVPRSRLLWDTLYLGFWRHFLVLPLLLAPWGWWQLWQQERSRPLAVVIGCTWLVSGSLGVLPLITAAPLTTRWLMFSAWAIAVAAGVAVERLWRRQAGKVAAVAVTGFVAAGGVWTWLAAVVYRIRPPEPF